jgi:hypothetical protein
MSLCEEIQVFLLGSSSDNGQLTSQLILLPVYYSSEIRKVGMASISPSVWYECGNPKLKICSKFVFKEFSILSYINWDSHGGESEENGLLECDVAIIWQIAVSQKSTCSFCHQYSRKWRQQVTGTYLKNCVVLHYRKQLSEFDYCNLCQHRYENCCQGCISVWTYRTCCYSLWMLLLSIGRKYCATSPQIYWTYMFVSLL